MSAPPASLDSIPNTIAATSILPFVTSSDWLNFRAASRRCYEIIHGHHDVGATQQQEQQQNDEESEALWRLALVRDYRFEELQEDGDDRRSLMYQSIRCHDNAYGDGPFLTTSDVFTASKAFESWKHWRKIDVRLHPSYAPRFDIPTNSQVVGPYFLRAASLWQKIEQWCSDESLSGTLGPIIQSTLIPGFAFDSEPPNGKYSAMMAICAFYSGQSIGAGLVARRSSLPGLFGGYSAYDSVSHSYYSRPIPAPALLGPNYLMIADDVALDGYNYKTVLDVESGEVRVFVNDGRQAVMFNAVNGDDEEEFDDQYLRWFEHHANQLRCYSVGDLAGYQSILRYPNLNDPSRCSRAVTRGVEVVASSVYSAAMSLFIYSIRIRLLRPEDGEGYMTAEERGFDTCQLVSRYWRITHGNIANNVEEVRGEGVIGYYPMLREGEYDKWYSEDGGQSFTNEGSGTNGEYFSYQSCTRTGVSMEGQLQFKVGDDMLLDGGAEVFDVRVAPFPLRPFYSNSYNYM
jgi:hypothetical protein